MLPKKTLAKFPRLDGCELVLDLVAASGPDDDGSTPAIAITETRVVERDGQEVRTKTVSVTVAAHEIDRFAELVVETARLFELADRAPDPEHVRSMRRHREYLVRLAAAGDPQALAALREFDAKNSRRTAK